MEEGPETEKRPRQPGVILPPRSWEDPKNHMEALLESPWYPAQMELFNICNSVSHQYFASQGGVVSFAPVTTGSISSPMGLGSDSVPVKAEIGGRSVFLADSMQFALELSLRVVNRTTYYIQPSFRGEPSDARHLNQFIHIEAEIKGDLNDVIIFVEGLIRAMTYGLLDKGHDTLRKLGSNLDNLAKAGSMVEGFPRIRFDEAYDLLKGDSDCFEICETGDLRIRNCGEQELIRQFGSPCWLTYMPTSTVPFYQAVDVDDPSTSITADLLMGIGETAGAGQRAQTYEDVLANLKRCNVAPSAYDWYVEMKRRQPIMTSGFGVGLERFLLWATSTQDIRDWAFLLRNEFGEGKP